MMMMRPGGQYSSRQRFTSLISAVALMIFMSLHMYIRASVFRTDGLLVVMEADERSDRGAKGSQARTKAETWLCVPAACCHQTTDQLGVFGWWHLRMSCDLFSPSRATGIRQNPSPRHICFCVVRRDRDGDAVISGLDFSSTSTQLISLPPFFLFFLYLFISLSVSVVEKGNYRRD